MKVIINLEENPEKVVGRRKMPSDPFKAGMELQKLAGDLQKSLKQCLVPKGVFRFKTHQEADQWMLRMLARARKI